MANIYQQSSFIQTGESDLSMVNKSGSASLGCDAFTTSHSIEEVLLKVGITCSIAGAGWPPLANATRITSAENTVPIRDACYDHDEYNASFPER
jgi:hypothetical protein